LRNDIDNRRILVGMPIAGATAPNQIYVLDYREMETANDLASRSPIHISFTGKMICSDLSRKSTRWHILANCAEMLKLPDASVKMCIGGGNGIAPGNTGFAGIYWLDDTLMTDDDYGQVTPYYVTYFFVNHEMEIALQVGLGRKLYKGYSVYISGVGRLQITPYAATLANPYPSPPLMPLLNSPTFDIGDGLNVSTPRCAFKIASLPSPFLNQTDNRFDLQKFIVDFRKEPVTPSRTGAI